MMTVRVVRELLRRIECAQSSLDGTVAPYVRGAAPVPPSTTDIDDAREHLEHVRLTLVGAVTSHEQLAGRDIKDVR